MENMFPISVELYLNNEKYFSLRALTYILLCKLQKPWFYGENSGPLQLM